MDHTCIVTSRIPHQSPAHAAANVATANTTSPIGDNNAPNTLMIPPIAIMIGPLTANTAANANAEFFTGSGKFPNAVIPSATRRMRSPNIFKNGSAAPIRNESIEPFIYSIAPLNPFIRAPATSAAAPCLFTAAAIAFHSSVPDLVRIVAARIASAPKIVLNAAFRCSSLIFAVMPVKSCKIALNGRIDPSAL